jgi:hypothetical protein
VAYRQLTTAKSPDLFFVLAIRRGSLWEFVILPREVLQVEHQDHGAGSVSGANVIFALRFSETDVICSGRSWQTYRNNWSEWPILQP